MIRGAPVASRAVTANARPIEAVVFDMDGVLVDSEPMWRAVEREVFAGVGIELTDEDLYPTMGVRIADVVERWYRRHPWPEPSRAQVAETIVDGVARTVRERGLLLDGARDAVDHARSLGLGVALASSSPMALILAVLTLDGLAAKFDVVVSGEDEERGKPDPAVFLSAARRLKVPPERCLAVEDSINGVRAAKAAGMLCVAVPAVGGDADVAIEADLVLGSIGELDDRVWARLKAVPLASRSMRGDG
jgi:mannitol-1-/sugar-/sorbitol-6-/2-deoxyglucose-6-phosphatase